MKLSVRAGNINVTILSLYNVAVEYQPSKQGCLDASVFTLYLYYIL